MAGPTWFWLGSRSKLPTMPLGVLGDDRDDQLGGVVDRERRLGRGDRRLAVDERDGELAAERRRLGVQDVDLSDWVGSSTAFPNRVWPCEPPARRSSPATGGPSFLRWTAIATHDPSRAWPPSRTRASIVRPSAAATGAATGPSAVTMSAKAATIQEARRAPGERRGMSG